MTLADCYIERVLPIMACKIFHEVGLVISGHVPASFFDQRSQTTMPDPLPSLLETKLAAARADEETVTSEGKPTSKLPDGMRTREVPRHLDDRGSVVELYDTRWNWHPDPINFVWVMHS